MLVISAGDDRNSPRRSGGLAESRGRGCGDHRDGEGRHRDGGGVVVVAVAPSLISGSDPVPACSLAMTTPTAPMATTALAPMTADNNLTLFCLFEFTLTTPFGSGSSATMRRGVALMVQVRRGYPARPCKTPEMSDWQPIYRFSRQRHTGPGGVLALAHPRSARRGGGRLAGSVVVVAVMAESDRFGATPRALVARILHEVASTRVRSHPRQETLLLEANRRPPSSWM